MHWVITVLEYHFNKVAGLQPVRLFKKETPAKAFSCKFYEIYQNKFFTNCCHSLSLVSFTITCCYSLSFIVTHWHLLSLLYHSLKFVAPLAVSRCHSMSLVGICCHSLYHSLTFVVPLAVSRCHSLSLVGICCHSLYHSLTFLVPLPVSRCHSLSLVVPIVVNRCYSVYQSSVFLKNDQLFGLKNPNFSYIQKICP